ncbi:MAG: Kynureninase (L-kynurenine hydrolase) [Caeruleum heppii]|nr:MAG: Kynureninase (L-kynurenine hydrolase) [Caeruleum heppii]
MASVQTPEQTSNELSLFDSEHPQTFTVEYAQTLDQRDPLRHLRDEFIIPSKRVLRSKAVPGRDQNLDDPQDSCIYLCGNSLGLQPRRTAPLINAHLRTWAAKGVYGHFEDLEDTGLPPFVHTDEVVANEMAKVVGAKKEEVAVMETLTANIHLLMASFYKPEGQRTKIIMEGKAFPSDHVRPNPQPQYFSCLPSQYAVESQIRHHDLDPSMSMILIEPESQDNPTLTTAQILSIIDHHASTTALIFLPGVQYYTGQYFDIATITAHAHSKGLLIGWDLAHAAGNVELRLHDWDVDFAVWCNYKYLNAGPGTIGALFVHERHGRVDRDLVQSSGGAQGFRPRLCGWWGGDKSVRFQMRNQFLPIPGAAGYQVGNPSALDLTAVSASLAVFALTDMAALRRKSCLLTSYLELLLLRSPHTAPLLSDRHHPRFRIITPADPATRGAQLSIRLEPGLLDEVMRVLAQEEGVVVDERKPDVVRVAPAPLYNSFADCWGFAAAFGRAMGKAVKVRDR